MRTTGDRQTQRAARSEIAGDGVFSKELETALLAGEIDMAVHSLKDLPTAMPDGLTVAAVTRREDPRDALVSRDGRPAGEAAAGGTHRHGQRAARRPVAAPAARHRGPVPIRGNVDTRLRKVEVGRGRCRRVAAAALARIGWLDRAAELLSFEAMLPAPGQGRTGRRDRSDDEAECCAMAAAIDDRDSRLATTAERAFLRRLGGGCSHPGRGAGERSKADGCASTASSSTRRAFATSAASIEGPADDAESLGERLAEESAVGGRVGDLLKEMAP